ncbi:hypothetical protein [Mycolicibacterium sp. P1-18]|uniref:hypothetical protein n=1 Tax=Mycolicibacterium sp. P1-18 TaxID=2024615 RepID=UPI001563EEB0|nr:hypothetical protein [Mycolicibacterium sp. P1-18]
MKNGRPDPFRRVGPSADGYGEGDDVVVVGMGSVEVVMPPPAPSPQPAKIVDAVKTASAHRMFGA